MEFGLPPFKGWVSVALKFTTQLCLLSGGGDIHWKNQPFGGKLLAEFTAKRPFDCFTLGKSGNSPRSPWVSISRVWRSVESLALFKLGNGSRIGLWTDIWVGASPLKALFTLLYRIALLPHGSVADH